MEDSIPPEGAPARVHLPRSGPGPGDVVGEHRLERPLGKGGMATVFVGRHLGSGALHAVKLQTLAGKPERLERFAREARALAKVDRHPGVVRVHAHGVTPAGQAWLALELVEGTDLGQLLARGPLEPARALRVARGVASALAHVHAQGVTHRDLKPGNVLLRRDDSPALADFGLALDLEEERLTQTKQLLGTPAYMAPEQLACRRDALGPATDVFALGVLLHELLTGERPWDGESTLELAVAQLEQEPRAPSARRPGLPPGVDDLVHACLAVDPAVRPGAAAVEAALARVERGEPAGLARGPRRPRRRLGPAVAAVLALCLPVGVGAGVALAVTRRSAAVAVGPSAASEREAAARLRRAVRLAPALDDPAAVASARAALAAGPQAPPGEVEPALEQAAREVRSGAGAAARIEALQQGLRARGPLAPEVLAELLLHAARAALAEGDPEQALQLARQARSPEPLLAEVAARLEARAHLARAVGRAAALDAAGVEGEARAARRASAREADLGAGAVVEAALGAARAGDAARAELLADTLLALRATGTVALGPEAAVALRDAARRAIEGTTGSGTTGSGATGSGAAGSGGREARAVALLRTAVEAEPELAVPSPVVLPFVLLLHERLRGGALAEAHALALLCIRAGEDPSNVMSTRDTLKLGQAGLISAAAADHPDDPAALYWLADWLVDLDPRDPQRRASNLARAVDVAARVAEARLPLVTRNDARVLEVRARIQLRQPDAEARVEALRARGFPMVHLLEKGLAMRAQGEGRHEQALVFFDRALAGLLDLDARARAGTLPPGARPVREAVAATAHIRSSRLESLLILGRLEDARAALVELEGMDRLAPLDQRARLLFAEGRHQDALVEVDAALAREPARLDLLELRARVLRALDDPRAGEAEARVRQERAGR